MDDSMRMERDPVCGMMVGEWERHVVYRGVGYAFCSQQCRERFSSSPGLYVRRRKLAPKQIGMEVIKHRRIVLDVPLTHAEFVELKRALLSMMGVMAVWSDKEMSDVSGRMQTLESYARTFTRIDAVEISYDLLQATAAQIERRLVDLNALPSNGWGERLQRDFIHYIEKCELDDLQIHDTDPVRSGRGARRVASGFQKATGTSLRVLDRGG